jgi:hypothetical protein
VTIDGSASGRLAPGALVAVALLAWLAADVHRSSGAYYHLQIQVHVVCVVLTHAWSRLVCGELRLWRLFASLFSIAGLVAVAIAWVPLRLGPLVGETWAMGLTCC